MKESMVKGMSVHRALKELSFLEVERMDNGLA